MNLDYRKIEHHAELGVFQHYALKYIGVSFPLSFLECSEVYAGFNDQGLICSGFLLSSDESSFRAIAGIPEEARRVSFTELSRMIEITGLWIDKDYRSMRQGIHIADAIIKALQNRERPLGLLTYSSSNKGLERLYALLNGKVLYSGEVKMLEGMSKPDHETVLSFEIAHISTSLLVKMYRWSAMFSAPAPVRSEEESLAVA